MDKYSLAERARFVDALFDVIRVTGAKRFSDIMADRKTNVLLMLEAVEGLDPDLQQFIRDVLRSFARTATVEKAAGAASGIAGTIKKARPSVALASPPLRTGARGPIRYGLPPRLRPYPKTIEEFETSCRTRAYSG